MTEFRHLFYGSLHEIIDTFDLTIWVVNALRHNLLCSLLKNQRVHVL